MVDIVPYIIITNNGGLLFIVFLFMFGTLYIHRLIIMHLFDYYYCFNANRMSRFRWMYSKWTLILYSLAAISPVVLMLLFVTMLLYGICFFMYFCSDDNEATRAACPTSTCTDNDYSNHAINIDRDSGNNITMTSNPGIDYRPEPHSKNDNGDNDGNNDLNR